MTGKGTLLQAVNELEATFRRSAELAGDHFNDNRKEAVQIRRQISDQVAAISAMESLAFETDEAQRAFRGEFSKMRSTMAHHHASWPIVSIDLQNGEYLSSVKSLRESNSKFIAWVRSALAAS